MKDLKNSTCDCGMLRNDCQFFIIYRCKTGRHDTAYEWKKPFPVKNLVLEE